VLEDEKFMSIPDTVQFIEELAENAFVPENIAQKLHGIAECIKYIDDGINAFGGNPADVVKTSAIYRILDETSPEEIKKKYMKNKVECEEIRNRVRIDNVLEEEEDEEEC